MALPNLFWYTRDNTTTTGWSAVAKWAASTSYPSGSLVRQLTTPAVGSERVFLSISAATQTSGTTQPTWVITKGGTVVDNTNITWQEVTGQPAVNGDTTNTPTWAVLKAAGTNPTVGFIIQNNAGTSLFICSTSGAISGLSQPTFVTTSFGVTTTDNAAVWKYIGPTGNYSNWAAPHARVANALTANWGAAGDTFCVGSDHAETSGAAITWSVGTSAAPVYIYCISTSTIPPTTTTTGASVTDTGTLVSITVGGFNDTMFINGITFNASGTTGFSLGSSGGVTVFENCTLNLVTTSSSENIAISGCTFRGCFFTAANVAQVISLNGGYIDFIGCDLFQASGSTPTNIFTCSPSTVNIRGCTFPNTILLSSVAGSADITIEGCSGLHTLSGAGTSMGGPRIKFANYGSNAVANANGSFNYNGSFVGNATTYRSGGGVDASWGNTGGTSLAGSLTTAVKFFPFESQPFTLWCSTTGTARTLTVYLTSSVTLTNAQFWMTVEYLDNGSNNHATELSTRPANPLVTPTALTTDSVSTWTSGAANNYSISATVTPQQIGPIRVRLYSAATGSINIDPLIVMV
jgi:hypothetical protein